MFNHNSRQEIHWGLKLMLWPQLSTFLHFSGFLKRAYQENIKAPVERLDQTFQLSSGRRKDWWARNEGFLRILIAKTWSMKSLIWNTRMASATTSRQNDDSSQDLQRIQLHLVLRVAVSYWIRDFRYKLMSPPSTSEYHQLAAWVILFQISYMISDWFSSKNSRNTWMSVTDAIQRFQWVLMLVEPQSRDLFCHFISLPEFRGYLTHFNSTYHYDQGSSMISKAWQLGESFWLLFRFNPLIWFRPAEIIRSSTG